MVRFLKEQGQAVFEEGLVKPVRDERGGNGGGGEDDRDDIYWRAVELIVSQKQASISFIQRRMGLGYPKAARFIDLMEQDRIIGPGDGAKPRQILVGPEYLLRRSGSQLTERVQYLRDGVPSRPCHDWWCRSCGCQSDTPGWSSSG